MRTEMSIRHNPLKTALSQYEAYLFDLDGTLVDSMWMWHAIDIEYLGRFGIPLPEHLQQDIEGMSFSETAVYFKKRFALPDSLDEIKAEWNRMACDKYRFEVPMKEGALAFLSYAKAHHIPVGVATSNSRELVSHVVEAHNLSGYLSCIVTACEVERGKPAPDVYLAAAERLGVLPEKCLVFEDILPGIRAGQAAGMRVCAVEDAYSANVREQKCRLADYFIDSYSELL